VSKYYTFSTDVIFKNTFDTEESLKRLLSETLNLNINKIYKSNSELSVDNIKERRKYLDLILETDKGIVNVEINHGYKDEIPNRNFLYLCKLISTSVRRSKSYININKHIQLNITWNLKKYLNFDVSKRKIIYFHLADDKSHEIIHDNLFEIVHINMDYFKDVWYYGDVKKENPFLMLLAAPTEDEMDEISKGDRVMEELNEKVKKLNQDSEILDVIIEDEEEIIANSLYEKGIEKGINQNRDEIVKKMLEEGSDIKFISKVTGLSEKEIKNIGKL